MNVSRLENQQDGGNQYSGEILSKEVQLNLQNLVAIDEKLNVLGENLKKNSTG